MRDHRRGEPGDPAAAEVLEARAADIRQREMLEAYLSIMACKPADQGA